MLTYSLEHKNNRNLYEYFYECIKNDIISGRLQPEEKLPSKRAFAANNGISTVTVENTYGQLMAEGYIYSRPKSGFYVARITRPVPSEHSLPPQIPEMTKEGAEPRINLVSNHTAPASFPFSIWAKLTRQLLSEQDQKLLLSSPAGGVMELRKAIARHLSDFRGISCQPEQVIIGAGTEYLYGLIVQLLGRDRIYGLENPGSRKILHIYRALGVKTVPLSLDDEGVALIPENLTLPDILQISPSHHFPTGIVTSASRRYGLLQWANEAEGRYIIEDDYDSEFRLLGKPIPSLYSMDTTDRVIYFNTFTKTLASTIRISYMVLPRPLLLAFYEKLGFYSCTVSNFEQYALARFIAEQYFEKHINRMRIYYKNLRDKLIRRLMQSSLASKVQIMEADAGLHFLLKIDTDLSDAQLKKNAGERGLTMAFLSDYYSPAYQDPEEKYLHTAIINYSGLLEEDIELLVEILETATKG